MIPDPETIVAQHFPLHGPYSDEHTHHAGGTLSELVRYLNYATGQGRETALPYASTAGGLVGHISAVAAMLDQTLRQLGDRCDQFAADPKLYEDSGYSHDKAVAHAQSAQAGLADARRAAASLHTALNRARSFLTPLGHADSAGEANT